MPTRILGIDPGSRVTGFAVLESQDRVFKALCCDVIRLAHKDDPLERLTILYSEFANIIDRYQPDICAIETPVYGKDPLAMLKLGRAQAAIIMSVLHKKLPLFEYYPKAVKKAITGSGNASKAQVAFMLHKLISISENDLPDDATDALAVAWCHHQKLRGPETGDGLAETSKKRKGRNTWSSFVENNPGRIRK